ncbi:hypothetical protein PMKS-000032 [Pichia membranifaciens]|uniref:Protein kinase domain-containing protein n=1 Tax=Pichia membranifaciens TaxID=4926 RepID=A0A1Q2YAT7_9ASCO|nr:hypothetical protein PMKS-000032 [Pichia membranifaciens]
MSLVRYNTTDSLEPTKDKRSLSIVYKNNVSNEVVLYDPVANNFQVVQLRKNPADNGSRNQNLRRNSVHSIGYNHGMENTSINSEVRRSRQERWRRRSDNRNPMNNVKNSIIGVDTISDSDTDDRCDDDDDDDMCDTFLCSVCGAYNRVYKERNASNNHFSDVQVKALANDTINPMNFTTTSSGNFIRGDYFKLLTNSMNGNVPTEGLITDGTYTNPNEDDADEYTFQTIPENLINQGYFDKFFKILSKLGTGSYGSVYKVEHDLLGLNLGVFALKKIPIGDDINNLKKILSEVKFLYDLSCNFSDNSSNNNVVKYNHVWVEIDQVSRFSPKIPVVFLLFEYCDGGTLEEWVDAIISPKFSLLEEKLWRKLRLKEKNKTNKPRYLNNYEIFKIFSDITQGLNYLHNLKILHRDLKPSNCLFRTKFVDDYQSCPVTTLSDFEKIPTLLVSDFGESVMVNSIEENWQSNIETTGTTGTLEFCAPEIILQRKKVYPKFTKFGGFSYASDVYSLGMILYYLCFGKLPFSTNKYDPDEISDEILSSGLFKDLCEIRPLVSHIDHSENSGTGTDGGLLQDWAKLIEMMVAKNPNDRPSTSEVLNKLVSIYDKLNFNETYAACTNAIEDDESEDHEYSNKSDYTTDDDLESEVENGSVEEKITCNSSVSFSNVFSSHSTWMVVMFIIDTILLNHLSEIYPTKKVLMAMNLQFLILGLYLGGSGISWLPILQIFNTVVITLSCIFSKL